MRAVVGAIRIVHPAPAAAVVALSAALGAILTLEAGLEPGWPLALTTLSVAGSQILTGALNDWADRDRDRLVQPTKPIPAGDVTPGLALAVAVSGAALQLAASIPLGPVPLLLGAVASAPSIPPSRARPRQTTFSCLWQVGRGNIRVLFLRLAVPRQSLGHWR